MDENEAKTGGFELKGGLSKQVFWGRMDVVGISKAEFAEGMGVDIRSLYNWNAVPQYAVFILRYMERLVGADNVIISRGDWDGLVATQERWLGTKELAKEFMERINDR